MKIRKGDNVQVLTGKDKGKSGKIIQVLPTENRVVVDGVNKMFKHARSAKRGDTGQKIDFFAPVNESNLALVCPKCSKATRIGYKVLEDGKKIRTCKKCKASIE